ncbi:hypothetical protein P692DRAFT_20710870 [Suillus brevipes Sb2]|nr:hypothetical protein P692DRAFT_20710870 [Suillus brevipes Sb2]
MDAVATQSVTLDSLQAQQDVFVAIASFTILCWDHAITFADEVDLMWCKRKGPLGYLFLLNRYITPLGFVVNIVGEVCYCSRCRNFVRYQGAMATFGVSIAELIMLMRVHALYRDRKLVAVPGILLLAWVALEVCLMALGKLVPHAQQIHSCREVYDLPPALSATRAWLPLAYDTAIFIMTLWRTWPSDRSGATGPIFQIFQSDGILYFIVICSANIVLTVMIVRAPPGLKGIAAK